MKRDQQSDESLEAEVRSVLHQTIVPPRTPEYVRYRVEAMDTQSASARQSTAWRIWDPRRLGRRQALAVRAAVSLVAVATVVASAWVIGLARQSSPVASPYGSAVEAPSGFSIWSYGRLLNWDVLAGGVAFVYVDGKGLFLTADQGRTWSGPRQIPPSDTAQDHYWDVGTLDFVDARHGWVTRTTNDTTGSVVTEYRTNDGGETWQATPIVKLGGPASADAFVTAQQHFIDLDHGRLIIRPVGASDCQIWTTTDGGGSWAGPRSGSCIGLDPTVTWVTRLLGYANRSASTDPTVYVTEDGGASWQAGTLGGTWARPEVQLLVSSGERLELVAHETAGDLPDVAQVSADHGLTWHTDHEVAAGTIPGTGAFEYWAQSPTRWTAIALPPTPTASCAIPTCTYSATSAILESEDEGRTWSRLSSAPLYGAWGLRWWDDQHGFVLAELNPCFGTDQGCGDTKVPFITEDGGRTWRAVSL